ncbi:hypothetical protein [Shimia sp.]|uniref:hypothetical protein n=1 Tax=Shimia sp. TaxID=1954381 RepID=UPI003BAD81BC
MTSSKSVRTLLLTSTVLATLPMAALQAQEVTDIDEITVQLETDADQTDATLASGDAGDEGAGASNTAPGQATAVLAGTAIDSDDPANSGKTTLDGASIAVRAIGNDANTAFRTLPNVQYRSDVNGENKLNDELGDSADDVLSLQPEEFSISGAQVGENNIMIDGVGINSIALPNETLEFEEVAVVPNLTSFYGLHSQTQYIPSSLVDEAEVLDSNVSARHGGFLGGVVNYKLRKPTLDGPRGSASLSFESDDTTKYTLGTEDGENPQDRNKPEWNKQQFAFDYSLPVSDRTALLFAYTTERASATKQRAVQYGSEEVDSDSRSDFYRLGLLHELDNGGVLSGSVNFTDYDQTWNLAETANNRLDITNQALLGELGYEKDLGQVGFLRNATLELGTTLQNNEVENDGGERQAFSWIGLDRSGNDFTDAIDGCDADLAVGGIQNCLLGGSGVRTLTDQRIGFNATLSGEVGNGTLITGMSFDHYKAGREGTGLEYYTNALRNFSGACNAGDPSCNADQYFFIRNTQDAYDVDVNANAIGAFAEIDQTFGDWYLRGGLRMDRNDVLKNVDIAPRLTATWKPKNNMSLTFGANRYYDDNFLAYAVHDAVPLTKLWLRGTPTADWNQLVDRGATSYTGSNLDTPYNDELSVSLAYTDNWAGLWRLRALHRKGRDLFAAEDGSNADTATLTNDGTSEYKSLVLEYQKSWQPKSIRNLDGIGILTSVTWSKNNRSNNTYFSNGDVFGDRVLYNGNSYDGDDWDAVSGSFDQPLRASVEVQSSWYNGGIRAALAADITGAYDGVIDTGDNQVVGGIRHDVYEDHAFGSLIQLNLNTSFRVARLAADKEVRLDVKINNLLDKTPEGTATDSSPWIGGRSIWFGTSMTF